MTNFLVKKITRLTRLLTVLKGVICLLRAPGSTSSIYDIEDGLRYEKSTQLSVDFIKKQPEVGLIIQERYLAPKPEIKALEQFSPGSLGYCYASYLKKLGLQLDFYRNLKVDDDTSYILLRRRQTHDIWHIVTGFGTDLASELGLKAFELAQMRNPLSIVILTGGLLRTTFKAPESLEHVFKYILIGYSMGVESKPLLAQKWEDNWNKPLFQLRKELEIFITPPA